MGDDPAWFLYLVRCAGGQLYAGISTDVERRLAEHASGNGAKFLRGKAPLELVFRQAIGNRSDALKAELAVKRMSRAGKESLIAAGRFEFSILGDEDT